MTTNHIGIFTDSRNDLGSIRPSRWTDQPAVKRKAQVFVASRAEGVEDCRELLSMLGLLPTAKDRALVDPQHPANTVTLPAPDTGGPA